MLINHIALFVTQILLVCLMVCPRGDPSHTHTHTTCCNLALSYLPLSVSASISFISSISLSIPSRSVFLFFYSSCLLSLWRLSLCFAAFQSPCAWECRQMFDQNMHKHKDTHGQAGVLSVALFQHKLIVVYTVKVVWLCSKGEHGLHPWPLRCFVHTMLHSIKLNDHF